MKPIVLGVNKARVAFADWIKREHPDIYATAMRKAQGGTLSEGETTAAQPSFWQRFVGTVSELATAGLAYSAQKRILDTNIERAAQGLPPIDMATGAPVLRTQVEISPEIAARLQQTAGEAIPKMLLLGVAAIAAIFLLRR